MTGVQTCALPIYLNSVQLFNSLAVLPSMNWMLMVCIDAVLSRGIDFWVFHLPGERNVVADLLSLLQNSEALCILPSLTIAQFQPPHLPLGAAQK